ncbi:MAG TPA: hypothetical protein VKG43_02925 [Acidimicrobiales bacterium]|nr:hypothetical protein [Acidimicrobiales bacterium]
MPDDPDEPDVPDVPDEPWPEVGAGCTGVPWLGGTVALGAPEAPEMPTLPDELELGTVEVPVAWCGGVSRAASPIRTTTAALAPAATQAVMRRTLVTARSRAA